MIYSKSKKSINIECPWKIGDRVVCTNKFRVEYGSHGKIVQIGGGMASVIYDFPKRINAFACVPYQGTLNFNEMRLEIKMPEYMLAV